MRITTAKTRTALTQPTDLLVIPISGRTIPKPLNKTAWQPLLAHHINHADFTDQAGSSVLFYPHGLDTQIARVLIVQLGKKKPQEHAGIILKAIKARLSKLETCGIMLPVGHEKQTAKELAVDLQKICFRYLDHKTTIEDSEKFKLETITIYSDKNIDRALWESKIIGDALFTIKLLAHQPANTLTPEALADYSQSIAKKHGLKFQALNEAAMEKLGMGGILGVSRGSDEEARLIVLEHNPKAKFTVALVGKGITFDSGGISIKPAKDMHEMKYDMIGGATILAVLQAASELKLPLRLVGIIAASENLPSGKAIKPGDVVKTLSGKTVEIINTDAEGRMVLADGLTFAQRQYKPNLIIDVATLTGAVVVSLGNKITGAIGNNAGANERFSQAAKRSGEDIHFLPLYQGYNDELKSSTADLTNIGRQRTDALIAGLFLSKFIEKQTPWIHLDIAGTAWNNEGPTGVMLESILDYLKSLPKRS